MLFQRQNAEVVTLGSTLGVGGEGSVYPIAEDQHLVAKVYHQITDERIYKLAAMLANPPDDPMAGKHTSIAWPVDLLFTTDSNPHVVGYLMPRVSDMRPVFDFYNPKTRRQHCPLFNYSYLYRAARNLASAVHALHARGYVIGDVNESNILVSDTTLVTLVDTDSFQVPDAKHNCIWRCPVGKPEFTPPELQGRRFADVDRAPEHDLFGLGVVIFQMLMEGTHPFAGKFQGLGDPPPVEQRISSGHFPHGRNGNVPYDPPPTGLPFATLNPNLQQLFRQCFVDGHRNPKARPDAQTWRYALQGAEDAMKRCSTNDQHFYSGHLGVCPWCIRRQQLSGRDAFPSADAVRRGQHLRPAPRQTATPSATPLSGHQAQPLRMPSSQGPTRVQQTPPSWAGIPSPTIRRTPPPPPPTPTRTISLGGILKVAVVLVVLFFVGRSLFWNKPEPTANAPTTSSTKETHPTTPPASADVPPVASPAVVAKIPETPKIAATSYVPPSLVVSQSGRADYTTITDAINNAKSGDTITVRPGTYRESRLVISKPLRIVGDGPRDTIVIENPDGDTCMALDSQSIYVKGLSLHGAKNTSNIIYVYQGDSTIEDCEIDASTGSRLGCIGVYVSGNDTAYATVRSCKVTGGRDSGVRLDNGRGMLIVDSVVSGNQFGVFLQGSGELIMSKCNVTGNEVGIVAYGGARGTIENCDLRGNSGTAIDIAAGAQIKQVSNLR